MPVEPLGCSAVLTHHWLVRRRGGEKVLEAIAELLPDADVYTLAHDPGYGAESSYGDKQSKIQNPKSKIADRHVYTSLLQRIPGALTHYPKLLPLMPWAAHRMKLPPVDLVVCSDAAIAKAMTPDSRSKLVCYCHSPMRYVWEPDISLQYAASLPAILRALWPALCSYLRKADLAASQRVDQFIANSQTVADRIRRHYGRDSVVIYPPAELPDAPATGPRENFCLCVGHHVAYKRLDLAVVACQRLRRPLIVVGGGPGVDQLRGTAGTHVTFLGYQPDSVVHDHYRRARALLFPGEEDFGIVPVEAMAHGCPVIAYGRGGARETVVDGVTGVHFETQTVEGIADAICRADALAFDPRQMHEHARQFSRERFLREMHALLRAACSEARSAQTVLPLSATR